MKGRVLKISTSLTNASYAFRVNHHTGISGVHQDYFIGDIANNYTERYFDQSTQITCTQLKVSLDEAGNCGRVVRKYAREAFALASYRVRFSGKGYKIKRSKRSRNYRFYFGRSHKAFVFIGGLASRRLAKQKLLLLSNNRRRVNNTVSAITGIRNLNRFTKRGLRCTKQFILKRPGKRAQR